MGGLSLPKHTIKPQTQAPVFPMKLHYEVPQTGVQAPR